jgi:hypothetical protein
MKRVIFLGLATLTLLASTCTSYGQKTNPISGINWPLQATTTQPVACSAAYYGNTWLNTTASPATLEVCDSTGWHAIAGASGITALTGDVTASGSGSVVATLATVTTANCIAGLCYNAKGLVTGPAFAITSFTCDKCAAGPYEVGFTVASPTSFTSTYSATATSGSVSDGTNTSPMSPPNATSQSGSLAHSYTRTTAGNTTFTLTAIGSTTQTSQQNITWIDRVFGGLGTAGATGCTASGTSCTLVGATGTLASAGLGNQGSYGPYTPSGSQYVYVMALSNSCSFTLGGFSFPMHTATSFTFTNQYSATYTLWMYQSTNPQSAAVTLAASGC